MATIESLTIEKQRSWLQRALPIAAWVAGVLAVVMVVAYPVVTSSGFIKRVILPRVSAAIHADVTVTDISVHPFSKITVRGLKVQAKGQEPFITAPEVSVSYSLWSILGGNLRVYEAAFVSPTVALVENPDGSSNLDALKASNKKPSESKPPQPGKSAKPQQVDLGKLTLSNATIRKIKNYPGGRHDSLELTNVNVLLANAQQEEELKPFQAQIPRLFMIESEYHQALRRAEADWVRGLLKEFSDGTFPDLDGWRQFHQTGKLPDHILALFEHEGGETTAT